MALDESSADLQETNFLGEISYAASKVARQFQGGFRAPVGVSRRHQQKDSDSQFTQKGHPLPLFWLPARSPAAIGDGTRLALVPGEQL
jgi:hypothetical protein